MNLIPWRRKREHLPVHDRPEESLTQLRHEMATLIDSFFQDPWDLANLGPPVASIATAGFPRTDLAESENEVTVTMELPGVDAKDLDVSVAGRMLAVRGEQKHEREEKQKNYHYIERRFGEFQRNVQLPSSVDPSNVDATCKDGLLTVTIAKHPDVKPKRVAVSSA